MTEQSKNLKIKLSNYGYIPIVTIGDSVFPCDKVAMWCSGYHYLTTSFN